MSADPLTRLRELDAAATHPEWEVVGDYLCDIQSVDGYEVAADLDQADAALIAEMRNRLPDLLDVAEAARDLRPRGCSACTSGTCPACAAEDRLDAALRRLEGE